MKVITDLFPVSVMLSKPHSPLHCYYFKKYPYLFGTHSN